jgi:hypothetical protein
MVLGRWKQMVTTQSLLGYLRRLRPKANLTLAPIIEVGHTMGYKVNNMRMYWTSLLTERVEWLTTGIWLFAEYQIFYRVFFRALNKEAHWRVPRKKPSLKENTRWRSSLPSVLFLTLGKEFLCRVLYFWHSAKIFFVFFAECQKYNTRQRALCRVLFSTLGKNNLKIIF